VVYRNGDLSQIMYVCKEKPSWYTHQLWISCNNSGNWYMYCDDVSFICRTL